MRVRLGTVDAGGFFRPAPWFALVVAVALLAPWVCGICWLIQWTMENAK